VEDCAREWRFEANDWRGVSSNGLSAAPLRVSRRDRQVPTERGDKSKGLRAPPMDVRYERVDVRRERRLELRRDRYVEPRPVRSSERGE
jgi:hypothetical protein